MIVALALVVALAPEGDPCDAAREALSSSLSAPERARALEAIFADRAPLVVEEAQRAASEGASRDAALDVYRSATRAACKARTRMNADHARARAAAIVDDEAFAGARDGADLVDVLVARARAWFLSFLESSGMQRFAGVSRVVYLTLVVVAAVLLAARLLVESRRRAARQSAERTTDAAAPSRRAPSAAALLEAARAARARGALDDAAALAEHALALVLADGRDAPTRTHDELCRALDVERRARAREAVSLAERALFAADGRATPAPIDALIAATAALSTRATSSAPGEAR